MVFDIFGGSKVTIGAFNSGVQRLVPFTDYREAKRLKQILGQDAVILCGEKDGQKYDGFDLGCSPKEFEPAICRNKIMAYVSEIFGEIIQVTAPFKKVPVGGFNNLSRLADSLKDEPMINLYCAGRGEIFSFEDAVCAGMLISKLSRGKPATAGKPTDKGLDDNSVTARYLYDHHKSDLFGMLKQSERGQKLVKLGRQSDLEYMAKVDISSVIPCLVEDRSHFVLSDNLYMRD